LNIRRPFEKGMLEPRLKGGEERSLGDTRGEFQAEV
jgi:hypothetical protein